MAARARAIALLFLLLGSGLALAGDDLYDEKREAFASDAPKIEVARPDAEWLFVNVPVQRQMAEAAHPGSGGEFANLIARLHHPPSKATLSIFAFKGIAAAEPAKVEAQALEDVKRRKDWKLVEQTRGALGGRDVVRTDYYARVETAQGGATAGDVYFYSRIDAFEPEQSTALVIVFEAPKDRMKTAVAGWKKILKKLKLA